LFLCTQKQRNGGKTKMKSHIFKGVLATVAAGLSAYFGMLIIPLAVLIAVMTLDYVTGITKAWITKTLSSQIGLVGIVKKVCYLIVVCVAGVVDWIIQGGLASAGISYNTVFFFGLIVVIWLVINELISILENLGTIGVPLPSFLKKIVGKLKSTVESSIDGEE
jgi:toxin secretion/phage lysis holin